MKSYLILKQKSEFIYALTFNFYSFVGNMINLILTLIIRIKLLAVVEEDILLLVDKALI